MMRAILEPDNWLAEVFGHPVFHVALPGNGGEGAGLHLEWPGARTAFCYAKVAADRIDQVRALTAAGFYTVDVNLTFEQEAVATGRDHLRVPVRDARPEDEDDLLAIAGSCFVCSRFHLDPQVPAAAANAVKREWVRNYLRKQRGEQLLVAEQAGRPTGFLAVLGATSAGRRVRVIDLIGVGTEHQGRGVGRALVEAFRRESAGKSQLVRVGTQAANKPSIGLYQRCGFRLAGSSLVLHAHIKDGRVAR